MTRRLSVAIDGPAGAGKSTVAKLVAQKLGLLYVDTGAMYRALTLKAMNLAIDLNDETALTDLAGRIEIMLSMDHNGKTSVLLDGTDVTAAIRDPAVSRNVSLVARVAGVRTEMVKRQQHLAYAHGVVMDGRDICSVVLPQAEGKFFLTASPMERAKRRYIELRAGGHQVTLEQLAAEIEQRDLIDRTRAVSPLVPAPDALVIDSSSLSIEQVIERIINCVTGGT